jgi:uncharacterized protein
MVVHPWLDCSVESALGHEFDGESAMKTKLLTVLFSLLICLTNGVSAEEIDERGAAYDQIMASELGADDYGMRRYVMAFLTAGPNQDLSPERAAELQRGHMAHIQAMAAAGKLVMAGPFLDGGQMRGIFLFAVDSIEEAEALTAADPAVQAGRLGMELRPWYGSAALMKVNEIHQNIARETP